MATIFQFQPTPQSPFQFQPTLDGEVYNATVMWNVAGQRWYLSLADLAGDAIANIPVIGSPDPISLQQLSWANGTATGITSAPHLLKIASTVALTVAGCTPDAYNGVVDTLVSGPSSLSYPLAADPGQATILGTVGYGVNILGGYFSSSLVFRSSSQRFEVSP